MWSFSHQHKLENILEVLVLHGKMNTHITYKVCDFLKLPFFQHDDVVSKISTAPDDVYRCKVMMHMFPLRIILADSFEPFMSIIDGPSLNLKLSVGSMIQVWLLWR